MSLRGSEPGTAPGREKGRPTLPVPPARPLLTRSRRAERRCPGDGGARHPGSERARRPRPRRRSVRRPRARRVTTCRARASGEPEAARPRQGGRGGRDGAATPLPPSHPGPAGHRPPATAPPPDMPLPRLLLVAAALAAAAAPTAAFYLPGLAPVNFCEAGKEKPECKVSPGGAGGAPEAARVRHGLGVVPLPRGLCRTGAPRREGAVAAGTQSVVRFPLSSSCSQNG